MRLALFGVASAFALAAACPAFAADGDAATVDPVTVLGSRTEKAASEVPATISVITSEDLEDRLAADIRDVVKYEPGVSVRSSPTRFGAALGTTGRDGNAGFNIRGLEGNRVLIQVDGVRVPDGFTFGAQSVGRGDYQDLDLMKSVEILRGPASALYGSDGVAGAVSFTTKDPADFLRDGKNYGGRVRGAYGSADESVGGTVVAAGRQGRFSGMIAYTYREAGETETQGTNDSANTDRTTANPQDFLTRSVLGKLVYDVSDTNRIRLTAEHFDRNIKADVLSGIAKPPLAATSVLRLKAADETTRDRVGLDQRVELTGPIDRVSWSAYWQKSQTVQFTAEDRNVSADRTRLNTFDNRVFGVAAQLESDFALGGVDHKLIYGFDASKTRQSGLRDGTVPPAGEAFPTRAFPTTNYTLAGAFVQDEIAFLDGMVTLFPALRFDYYKLSPKADALLGTFVPSSSDDSRVSPKLGVVFKPTENARLFFNYAQGFRAPAPSQVNNAFFNPIQNYTSLPNPDLKAETSEAFEGGARWVTPIWSAEVVAFSGEYKNFIEQIQVSGAFTPTNPGVFQYVNLSKVKIHGIEGRARLRLENGMGAFLSAAYAKGNSYSPAKAPLDSIDPVKVSVGVSYRDPDGRFGGELAAVHTERKDSGRVAVACTPSCFRPTGSTVLDLTAFWRVADGLTARGGVFNITDETYAYWNDVRGISSTAVSRDAYTQPGRNVSLSLTYDF
ncbi:MAG: TonB-dependent hemoglobin/transferrin/lactoferrin family receptor [Alphaproteobacteria bacterium]|nr:TonB-dependent hemoglobin/transferrin/lactoferrin family receptor [Alphaproteobacteria bacterium]MBU1516718.1 TonB-dependent hemoglobin/transferrin/lactoferrin family receptor [Alphaproteobacteria bacterium]MBU2095908.1 TonB-dependent hemoglobin/transferrin/lactoferrin family receptor [Alphaproteobacteria bacterium]MBU2153612.1 TonB-dependent hemoglobin/transferrin/lactoferrin family receptor [Alphaproteobacteria bacterium]MBU2307344.1 TonB-dependent hemoglobin/transferrin/lactoferrin family